MFRPDVHRRTGVLFIENSIGLSGSTMSLCTLLNYLDPDVIEAHIVLSRPEQDAYMLGHLRRPGALVVIGPRRSTNQAPVVKRLLERFDRRPALRRLVLRAASLIDLVAVTLPYVWRLHRYAKARGVRLIHQNNGFDLASLVLARLLRVPLVAYQRGDEWNSFVVRFLARGIRHFIANSATTRASLLALRVPSGKISVIYPPLDLDTFQVERVSNVTRATFGLDASCPCFGIVGMLLPWKGHAVFLRAAAQVLERLPNARALVVGAVPRREKAYTEELRALAQELGIADRVIFTGFRDDVPRMLALLDVVVHASTEPEPFGRVIAEAMAMRRPVIATRAGGPTEIIEDGRTGFLVPPGDVAALADQITTLLKDSALAGRIAEAGYEEARERFSAEAHSALVQGLYDSVLRPKRTRAPGAERRRAIPARDALHKEVKR